ncbi:MAG: hypothetical protein J5666_08035, partial [Bacilli bacterium]|nr:hypothetical protein [Bacilli bacterium]
MGSLLLFSVSTTDSVFNVSKAESEIVYEKIDNPGATYKTQRIWLNNDDTSFYSDSCVNAVGY